VEGDFFYLVQHGRPTHQRRSDQAMTDTSASFHPITFDQLCNTLQEAVEGTSGETLTQQYDADENGSYARISHIYRKDGTAYALIQLEDSAVKTQDFTTDSINRAIEHLQQASHYHAGKLLAAMRLFQTQATGTISTRLH